MQGKGKTMAILIMLGLVFGCMGAAAKVAA